VSAEQPKRLLVVANETVGGSALIEAVKERAQDGASKVIVVCPQNQPRHGNVIYEDSVVEAVGNRLKLTLSALREAEIEAMGEIGDADPYSATMDAVDYHDPDEIIISTHPETRSGWLRRDLIDRVREDTSLPVHHVVVDLDADRGEVTHVLVVANQTVSGEALIERLETKAERGRHRFVVLVPQSDGAEGASERLEHTLEVLNKNELEAVGQVADADPLTAIQNALDYYAVDEIVVSTLPEARSGWLRRDLVGRVKATTSKPVEHIVVDEKGGAVEEGSSV
jgi:uncharacterized protein YciI